MKKLLIVPVTSNRGLCGGFNSGVVKEVNSLIEENKGAEVSLFTIGKKSIIAFKKPTEWFLKTLKFGMT